MFEEKYDVIVYERATRRVISITGRGLSGSEAENLDKLLQGFVNDAYAPTTVEMYAYALGDTLINKSSCDACEGSS